MKYNSTRDNTISVSASQAILQGISPEGGLFVPDSLPRLSSGQIGSLCGKSYIERSEYILDLFLDDFSPLQRNDSVRVAYEHSFYSETPAPVRKIKGGRYVLELFHGPTCAFKDMALQLLPQLMRCSTENVGREGETLILVATSGDTGKAALEGFKDAEGIKIMVFYPVDGVSPMQKLQMATQEGDNVAVCAVCGNFDNTQSGVKAIFTDAKMIERLAGRQVAFSSANSINWGRLLPQIIYYFSAYADLVDAGEIALGEALSFAVPTGNFGNILAAFYAREMGLPIAKLICASNRNKVLTDFIDTGCYNLDRDFHLTLSPSMDILISSNLERLLYHLLDGDDKVLAGLMADLRDKGSYQVPDKVREQVQALFYGGFCDDDRTCETIRAVYEQEGYLLDTHTAVAMAVSDDYLAETKDKTKMVVVSTASPYKFAGSVYTALTGRQESDEYKATAKLNALTGLPIPKPLSGLSGKPVRFTQVIGKEAMAEAVFSFIE